MAGGSRDRSVLAYWFSRLGLRSSFLAEHGADGLPLSRRERVLAIGRVLFTLTALIAVSLETSGTARSMALGHNLLAVHLAYSIVVLFWVSRAQRITPRHGVLLHAGDLTWAFVLTIVSGGPASPIFLYFLFSVVAAAYRWGLVETVATTATCLAMLLVQYAIAVSPLGGNGLDRASFQLGNLVIRVGTLVATAFLLGYLNEKENQLRVDLAARAASYRPLRVDGGVPAVVTMVCDQMLRTFQAAGVAVVVRQHDIAETKLWRLDQSEPVSQAGVPSISLGAAEQDAWLFRAPGRVWHAARSRAGHWTWGVIEQDAWGLRPVLDATAVPEQFQRFATITAADVGLAGEWTGRVYLFDLPADALKRRLHFFESLTDHISSAVTDALLQRHRSQATVAERARVARELHDGAIQSLLSLDLKIEALRRKASGASEEFRTELAAIQTQIQRETVELRNLMRALRPINLESREMVSDAVASVVERFQRETSIPAQFASTGGAIVLQRARAMELLRIVQEALVNVRKHSLARHVDVRLDKEDAGCVLVVADDGRGFDFEGRLSAADPKHRHQCPVVLQERAQTMGAALSVYSTPGSGARVELRFAEDQHA